MAKLDKLGKKCSVTFFLNIIASFSFLEKLNFDFHFYPFSFFLIFDFEFYIFLVMKIKWFKKYTSRKKMRNFVIFLQRMISFSTSKSNVDFNCSRFKLRNLKRETAKTIFSNQFLKDCGNIEKKMLFLIVSVVI